MIAVIDYGVGNLFSLSSSLRHLGFDCKVTGDSVDIMSATHIILPGVGAFGDAMEKLKNTGLIPELKNQAKNGKPLLGICLGMQMLFEDSNEYGNHEGLSLLKGKIRPMEDDIKALGFNYKVPQMGWNSLILRKPECPVLSNINNGDYVYYVHSYYATDCDESIAAGSDYGVFIPGVVCSNNVYGTQFHPEKSGSVGLALLKSFCEL
jgi:imidazole glycerol phosphate synthase, glutamine amidotransferase subunit